MTLKDIQRIWGPPDELKELYDDNEEANKYQTKGQ